MFTAINPDLSISAFESWIPDAGEDFFSKTFDEIPRHITKDVNFIFINTEWISFVPRIYFNNADLEQYISLQYGLMPGLTYYSQSIADDIECVYAYPASLQKLIQENYTDAKIFCSAATQTHNIFSKNSSLIFYKNAFSFCLKEENKFRFAKSTSYQTAADVMYHVLNVREVLNIKEVPFMADVFGFIHKDSPIYKTLVDYIDVLELPVTGENDLNEEANYFSHLTKLLACVL